MDKQRFYIGKTMPIPRTKYDAEASYYRLDIVEDADGNWFAAKQGTKGEPMIGKPLPSVNADGVQEASDYWTLCLWVTPLRKATAETIAATNECKSATAKNRESAALAYGAAAAANSAADKANAGADNAAAMATSAEGAAQKAKDAVARANEAITEMKEVSAEVASKFNGTPTRLVINGLEEISTANKIEQYVGAEIRPSYLRQNILYQLVEGTSISVDPSGKIKVNGVGQSKIWVIPTGNTSLWRERIITVRKPVMRIANGVLKLGNGIRIV